MDRSCRFDWIYCREDVGEIFPLLRAYCEETKPRASAEEILRWLQFNLQPRQGREKLDVLPQEFAVLVGRDPDGIPIGFCVGTPMRELGGDSMEWPIIYCAPDWRGSGAFRVAWDEIQAHCRSFGHYEVRALAINDRTCSIFEHLGFEREHVLLRKRLAR